MLIGIEYNEYIKAIVVSYYNKKGEVEFVAKKIPDTELFNWVKTNRITMDIAYNNKYVEKEYTTKLNRFRLEELFLTYFTKEEREIVHEFNMPQKYFLDIEVDVDPDNTFPDPKTAKWPINLITIIYENNIITLTTFNKFEQDRYDYMYDFLGNYFKDYFKKEDLNIIIKHFDTEKDLLTTFFHKILPSIPMLIGWYFIKFDWETLVNRAIKNNISITKKLPSNSLFGQDHLPIHTGIIDYIDAMEKFRPLKMVENLTLDYISHRVLKLNKLTNNYNSMYEFMTNDTYNFTLYNIVDTMLVKLIDDKLDLITPSGFISKISETEINRIFGPVFMSEMFLMRKFFKRKKHLYKKFKNNNIKKKYSGAFVFEPKPGYYEYIVSFDFNSMYPHIQIEFNISPDSYLGTIKEVDISQLVKGTYVITDNETIFDTSFTSVTKELLIELYSKRKEANNKIDEIKLYLKNNGIEL